METGKHSNRLSGETSPYLLQHAGNPVDWYPWGEEALTRSRTEDKPILLSIGYSACHWCHVMEHESFENEKIAEIMNENFVCIKVDREERPDIDSIYMNAVQMMTGHGGWPLTVFLTPDQKPFYGGTYYPPADRQGMPGFPRVLLAIADSYQNRRQEIVNSSESITGELKKGGRFPHSMDMLTSEILDQAFHSLSGNFDSRNGGIGGAPKFPPSMALMFLLRQHKRTGSRTPLEMVELTLDKMAGGGMYDQLGGGFARYSVDGAWQVPHFEKMLYDNALLVRTYLAAYQVTHRAFYRQIAEETLEYMIRDMTDSSGGFYSSEDADSEGEEGKFYVWTLDEVRSIVPADDFPVLRDYFDISQGGNFEHGTNILNTPRLLEDFAADRNMDVTAVRAIIKRGTKALFHAREQRIRPGRDEKILTAWNAMMLTAFAEAAVILNRDDYRAVAVRNAEFLLKEMTSGGRLLRTYRDGKAKLNAYLEDYSYLIEALIHVYEATFETRYLTEAIRLAGEMIAGFSDESEPGFFFTLADHEQLIARMKEYFDNATPSGNSVASLGLLKLAALTGDPSFQRPAVGILRGMQQAMAKYSSGFGYLLCALDFYLSEPKEIALAGPADSHEIRSFVEAIYGQYLPNKIVALKRSDEPDTASDELALLRGKALVDGKPAAYVCRNYTCLAPVTTQEELQALLEAR